MARNDPATRRLPGLESLTGLGLAGKNAFLVSAHSRWNEHTERDLT